MSIDIPFGGLAGQTLAERVPIERAITAADCYVDDNVISGRNGYRAATASPIGSGTIQAFVRFRPSASSARSVVVRGGHVYLITDPSSETASDGAVTDLGLVLPTTANVSATQLGMYLYLAPDDGSAWVRITPSYSVETISPLAQPTGTGATSTPTMQAFSSVASSVVASGGSLTTNYNGSGWYVLQSATPNYNVVATLTTAVDFTNCAYIFVAVSPMSRNSNGGTHPIQVEIGDNGGNYYSLGTILTTSNTGSYNGVYYSVLAVPTSIRSAVKMFRFTSISSSTTDIAFYGYYQVPVRPGNSTQTYQLSYYNSVLDQESQLSANININLTPFTAPSYPGVYGSYQSYAYNGAQSSAQSGGANLFNWSVDSTITAPSANDLVPFATVSGTSAATYGTATGQANQIRLYRITETGLRLVTYITNPGSGVAFSITDNYGMLALANATWIPSGVPQKCEALGAVGGRLVAGGATDSPQRLNISSFLAFHTTGTTYSTTSDPFPRFPATPTLPSDGWSFDCAPTSKEQVLWTGNGDNTCYMLTNEASYYMSDLAAPVSNVFQSSPIKIWQRGCMGRYAACWAEGALFWAATDGIFVATNRANATELTYDVKNIYRDTFQPDSTVVMGYQDRNLYAFCGTRFIRYNFVNKSWTTGTVAHTMMIGQFWRDPTGTRINFWMLASDGNLYRWQSSATTDGGTAIPNWTYSTGFQVEQRNSIPRFMFVDSTATVTVAVLTTASGTPTRSKSFSVVGEHELAFPPDLKGRKWRVQVTGGNTAIVKRVMFEYVGVAARGG